MRQNEIENSRYWSNQLFYLHTLVEWVQREGASTGVGKVLRTRQLLIERAAQIDNVLRNNLAQLISFISREFIEDKLLLDPLVKDRFTLWQRRDEEISPLLSGFGWFFLHREQFSQLRRKLEWARCTAEVARPSQRGGGGWGFF